MVNLIAEKCQELRISRNTCTSPQSTPYIGAPMYRQEMQAQTRIKGHNFKKSSVLDFRAASLSDANAAKHVACTPRENKTVVVGE